MEDEENRKDESNARHYKTKGLNFFQKFLQMYWSNPKSWLLDEFQVENQSITIRLKNGDIITGTLTDLKVRYQKDYYSRREVYISIDDKKIHFREIPGMLSENEWNEIFDILNNVDDAKASAFGIVMNTAQTTLNVIKDPTDAAATIIFNKVLSNSNPVIRHAMKKPIPYIIAMIVLALIITSLMFLPEDFMTDKEGFTDSYTYFDISQEVEPINPFTNETISIDRYYYKGRKVSYKYKNEKYAPNGKIILCIREDIIKGVNGSFSAYWLCTRPVESSKNQYIPIILVGEKDFMIQDYIIWDDNNTVQLIMTFEGHESEENEVLNYNIEEHKVIYNDRDVILSENVYQMRADKVKNIISPHDKIIASYPDERRHCLYLLMDMEDNDRADVLCMYDLKEEKLYTFDLTDVHCEDQEESILIASISDIEVVGNNLLIIGYNGSNGANAGELLIAYNTLRETFHYLDFGASISFVNNRTQVKVTYQTLVKEGSCSAENDYDFEDVIYDLYE